VPTRTDVANVLERVRRFRVCPSDRPSCDCAILGGPTHDRKATGCPEMRIALRVLESMTDEEFAALLAR
jgi:hypothetical protein